MNFQPGFLIHYVDLAHDISQKFHIFLVSNILEEHLVNIL